MNDMKDWPSLVFVRVVFWVFLWADFYQTDKNKHLILNNWDRSDIQNQFPFASLTVTVSHHFLVLII